MTNRVVNTLTLLATLVLWEVALRPALVPEPAQAQSPTAQPARDNEEVKRLFEEDQADRTPPAGKPIALAGLAARDKARLRRVKEIYAQNLLGTADDFDRAATVLQHGDVPEDFLLAHELWVVAISKGKSDQGTLAMAAASEDRYLMSIGRPQRFGTQIHSVDSGPIQLYPVDPGVTDELRRLMGGRTLAEVKARVAEMNKK